MINILQNIKMNDIIPMLLILFIIIVFVGILVVYVNALKKELDTNKRDIELIDKLIKEKDKKIIRNKKVFRIIKNFVFYLLLIVLIPMIIYSLYSRINGNSPVIGNKIIMVVGSDSMSYKNPVNSYLFDEPLENKDYQFKTGDIIIVDKINDDTIINQYDVVCYYNSKLKENIIHRIISINSNGTFEARGDAVPESDGYNLKRDEMLGIYNGKKISLVGNFVLFLQSMIGLSTAVGAVILMLSIDLLLTNLSKKERKRMTILDGIINYSNENLIDLNIYYLNYCYKFNHDGFILKEEIIDKELRKKSNNILIKEIKDNSGEILKEEIEIK